MKRKTSFNISDPYDSSQEQHVSLDYNSKTSIAYFFSFVLTDLGHRILLSDEVTKLYKEIKDPLKFKIDNLRKKLIGTKAAFLGLSNLAEIKEQNNNSDITDILKSLDKDLEEKTDSYNYIHPYSPVNQNTILEETKQFFLDTVKDQDKELKSIISLKHERDKLYTELQSAFPFILKRLTPTLIKNYQEKVKDIPEKEIIEKLLSIRDTLHIKFSSSVTPEINKLCDFLGVEAEKFANERSYKKETVRNIVKQIESVIGRYPTNKEVEGYAVAKKLFNANNLTNDEIKTIRNTVYDYVQDNLHMIHQTAVAIEKYNNYPEHLKIIEAQPYVVGVRAYRKLNVALERAVLTQGDEGIRRALPGFNTTVDIATTGSTKMFLGELGSYGKIAKNNTETLRHFADYIQNDRVPHEKEKQFKYLAQIEAIRNPSSLLTAAMFFELAKAKFEAGKLGQCYDFKYIKNQMPMAMKGAVAGAVYLEGQYKDLLTGNFSYDFREEGEKKSAEILDSRNNAILFDWLSYTLQIKNIESAVNTLSLNIGQKTVVRIEGRDWEAERKNTNQFTLSSNDGYTLDLQKGQLLFETVLKPYISYHIKNTLFKIKNEKVNIVKDESLGEYFIVEQDKLYLLKNNSNNVLVKFTDKAIGTQKLQYNDAEKTGLVQDFHLAKILSFPLDILNELIENWYKIKLNLPHDILKDIELKAAVGPKYYHYYSDDEEQDMENTAHGNNPLVECILPITNIQIESDNILNSYVSCPEPWVKVGGDCYANEILVSS